jgi:hypothetical protein
MEGGAKTAVSCEMECDPRRERLVIGRIVCVLRSTDRWADQPGENLKAEGIRFDLMRVSRFIRKDFWLCSTLYGNLSRALSNPVSGCPAVRETNDAAFELGVQFVEDFS